LVKTTARVVSAVFGESFCLIFMFQYMHQLKPQSSSIP